MRGANSAASDLVRPSTAPLALAMDAWKGIPGVQVLRGEQLPRHRENLRFLFIQMVGRVLPQPFNFDGKSFVVAGESLGVLDGQLDDVMLVDRFERVAASRSEAFQQIEKNFSSMVWCTTRWRRNWSKTSGLVSDCW
jgi:hypothetical protein